jgi:hypothetical protein
VVCDMTEYGTVLIGSEGGDHVSIIPIGRDSVGWLKADIEIRSDCWHGRTRATFRDGVLARFAQEIRQLRHDLVGTAELESQEPNIALEFSGDGKGHVTVDGTAQNDFARGTKLVFQLEIDQTFLNAIAEALEDADRTP